MHTTVVNRSVGMMDEAYFTSRAEILSWLNSLLDLRLKKIEETSNGAVACQVIDSLFPDLVPLKKINWGARTNYDLLANYKILQNLFNILHINRALEINKLIRGKYQDNLEFMQWLKRFFDDNVGPTTKEYASIAGQQRAKGKNISLFLPAQDDAPVKSFPSKKVDVNFSRQNTLNQSSKVPISSNKNRHHPLPSKNNISHYEEEIVSLKKMIAERDEEINELKNNADAFEQERDFYFKKLRDVEILLQNYTGSDKVVIRNILKILYATDEDVDGETALKAAEAVMKNIAIQEKTENNEKNEKDEQSNVEPLSSLINDNFVNANS